MTLPLMNHQLQKLMMGLTLLPRLSQRVSLKRPKLAETLICTVKSGNRKTSTVVDFEALRRYGYKGGPSVLSVPTPKEEEKQDWSWSSGKEKREAKESEEESFREWQKTRAALAQGEQLTGVLTRREREMEKEKEREKKNLSFSQKEKRKRELGQASRGKNYVEEEKRLLRDSGIYSGFDS